ncbi:MAG TPA: patatin-like phospholipase family protein [Crenalkalicoccus sp.]|nr:patatin-like phospholipase family protein [Crenalkalicoccus sp.]
MLEGAGRPIGRAASRQAEAWRRAREGHDGVVLLLQGGGALGSYQAGVYEALAATPFLPDWVAGISIGAVNSAIIVGNPPERRVERLREFWSRITSRVDWPWLPAGEAVRDLANQTAAWFALASGQPGFYTPRGLIPHLVPPGCPAAISWYDTAPLRESLLELVDFDLLNEGPVRISVGSVNVATGNTIYFDSRDRRIGPEHIMASGALPPGFPPVEIDGELYWDGGLVSNTPLQYVLDAGVPPTTIAFQVDLFSSRGIVPRTLQEADERAKDIRFSSRTRLVTNVYQTMTRMRADIDTLLARLPPEAKKDPEVQRIASAGAVPRLNLLHLIYRRMHYDRDYKDYEFSRNSMVDHWRAGMQDAVRTLRQLDWLAPPTQLEPLKSHDVHFDAAG